MESYIVWIYLERCTIKGFRSHLWIDADFELEENFNSGALFEWVEERYPGWIWIDFATPEDCDELGLPLEWRDHG